MPRQCLSKISPSALALEASYTMDGCEDLGNSTSDPFQAFLDDIPDMDNNCYSLDEIDYAIMFTSPERAEYTIYDFNCANSNLDKQHGYCSDNHDDDAEGLKSMGPGLFGGSKNVESERKRRKRLNESLLSLRALVPNISKMNKASIVSDTITYVQDLQKQIQVLKAEISDFQSNTSHPNGNNQCSYTTNMDVEMQPAKRLCKLEQLLQYRNVIKNHFKILALEVSKVEGHTFHIRITCKKEEGIILQLSRALQSLKMEVINAQITSFDDRIDTTVIAKMNEWEAAKEGKIEEVILKATSKYGLQKS